MKLVMCITAAISFAFVALTAKADVDFKAGYAKVDITPVTGTTMSGYYSRRVSTGVLDPLYARCVRCRKGFSLTMSH